MSRKTKRGFKKRRRRRRKQTRRKRGGFDSSTCSKDNFNILCYHGYGRTPPRAGTWINVEGYGIGKVLDFTKVSKLALPFYHSKHKIQFDNYPVPIELLLRRLKNGESNNGLNWTYNESSPEIRTDLYSPQSEIDEKAWATAADAQKAAAQKAALAAKKARQREEEENDPIPWFDYGGWADSDEVSTDKLLQQDAYRRRLGLEPMGYGRRAPKRWGF